jgi:hypothetical protein
MNDETQNTDPLLIGVMTPDEKAQMDKLRQSHQVTLLKIGQIEAQKQDLLKALDILDARGKEISKGVATRLGIAEGVTWTATPDGKIRLVPLSGQQQPPPSPAPMEVV